MGMFIISALMTKQEVAEMAAAAIKGIEKWFEEHPKKKVCNAELFYGKHYKIHRGTVAIEVGKIADGLQTKELK